MNAETTDGVGRLGLSLRLDSGMLSSCSWSAKCGLIVVALSLNTWPGHSTRCFYRVALRPPSHQMQALCCSLLTSHSFPFGVPGRYGPSSFIDFYKEEPEASSARQKVYCCSTGIRLLAVGTIALQSIRDRQSGGIIFTALKKCNLQQVPNMRGHRTAQHWLAAAALLNVCTIPTYMDGW